MVAISTKPSSRSWPGPEHFGSVVPLGYAAGDANLVRYVGNSPTNAVDPDGLESRPVGTPAKNSTSVLAIYGGGAGEKVDGTWPFYAAVAALLKDSGAYVFFNSPTHLSERALPSKALVTTLCTNAKAKDPKNPVVRMVLIGYSKGGETVPPHADGYYEEISKQGVTADILVVLVDKAHATGATPLKVKHKEIKVVSIRNDGGPGLQGGRHHGLQVELVYGGNAAWKAYCGKDDPHNKIDDYLISKGGIAFLNGLVNGQKNRWEIKNWGTPDKLGDLTGGLSEVVKNFLDTGNIFPAKP